MSVEVEALRTRPLPPARPTTISPAWVREAIRFEEDARSGAEVEQLTSEPVTSTNIYCEQRYASADGRRITIQRTPFGRRTELWVCDLGSLAMCRVAEGSPVGANAACNAVYYVASDEGGATRLMRLDAVELSTRELLRFEDGPPPRVCAVSPDERWLVSGPYAGEGNRFSLRRTDLDTGETETICTTEDIFNPHLQFEPGQGRYVVVQVNRGGTPSLPGGDRALVGPLGVTLCLIDVESGAIHALPVGLRPRVLGGNDGATAVHGRAVTIRHLQLHRDRVRAGLRGAHPGGVSG